MTKKWLLMVVLVWASILPNAKSQLLYEISGKKIKTSYLFGTYHLMPSDWLKDKQQLLAALNSADEIVVETVIDSSKVMMAIQFMTLPESENYEKYLNQKQLEDLDKFLIETMGVGIEQLKFFSPSALSTMLTMQLTQTMLADSVGDLNGLPLDVFIANSAKAQNKPVLQLETMEEQFKMLYQQNRPMSDQFNDLMLFVSNPDSIQALSNALFSAYKQQEINNMISISNLNHVDQIYFKEVMLENRNKNWITILQKPMKKKAMFIAVGALHLVGKDGLIELFQRQGYTVKAVALN